MIFKKKRLSFSFFNYFLHRIVYNNSIKAVQRRSCRPLLPGRPLPLSAETWKRHRTGSVTIG